MDISLMIHVSDIPDWTYVEAFGSKARFVILLVDTQCLMTGYTSCTSMSKCPALNAQLNNEPAYHHAHEHMCHLLGVNEYCLQGLAGLWHCDFARLCSIILCTACRRD